MFHKNSLEDPVPVPPPILKACLRLSRTLEAIRRYPHASRLLAFFSRSTVAWRHEASTASAASLVIASVGLWLRSRFTQRVLYRV